MLSINMIHSLISINSLYFLSPPFECHFRHSLLSYYCTASYSIGLLKLFDRLVYVKHRSPSRSTARIVSTQENKLFPFLTLFWSCKVSIVKVPLSTSLEILVYTNNDIVHSQCNNAD